MATKKIRWRDHGSANLGTVIRFEFLRTISKRRFWVATLFVPVMLIVVFLLVFLSNSSMSKSAGEQKNAHFSFEYNDASGLINPSIVDKLGGTEAPSVDAAGGGRGEVGEGGCVLQLSC